MRKGNKMKGNAKWKKCKIKGTWKEMNAKWEQHERKMKGNECEMKGNQCNIKETLGEWMQHERKWKETITFGDFRPRILSHSQKAAKIIFLV